MEVCSGDPPLRDPPPHDPLPNDHPLNDPPPSDRVPEIALRERTPLTPAIWTVIANDGLMLSSGIAVVVVAVVVVANGVV